MNRRKETGETHLHLLAKAVLKDRMTITLPPVSVHLSGTPLSIAREYDACISDILIEKKRGNIIPDAICKIGSSEVAVEFCMTHKVDHAKRVQYLNLGLSAIEVDLSRLWFVEDAEDQVDQILHFAPRKWVHNRVMHGVEHCLKNIEVYASDDLYDDMKNLALSQVKTHGCF